MGLAGCVGHHVPSAECEQTCADGEGEFADGEVQRGRGCWGRGVFAEHGYQYQNRGDRDYFCCRDDGLHAAALLDAQVVHCG